MFCFCTVLPLYWVQKQRRETRRCFKGFSLRAASQPDESRYSCSCFPKNSGAGSLSGSAHQLSFTYFACEHDNKAFACTSPRLSFISDFLLTHHQLEMSSVFCGVSPASRSCKKFVIIISGFGTSVGCYGECEVHEAAVSPGNMLRPPPRDESLSCPGVSGLPLRLSRPHASRDRPRLMSHHFLLPVSILILSPVHPKLTP